MKVQNFFKNTTSTGLLDRDALRSIVPSVFATRPADHLSDRYSFVNTENIINILEEDGYRVQQARGGMRKRSREFGMHEVRMRHVNTQVAFRQVFPEIVLLNSHDGTSSATLHMGLFRLVCMNGLVVGESSQPAFRVPHINDPRENVLAAARHMIDTTPIVTDTIVKWMDRQLTPDEIQEFGRRATELRNLSPAFTPITGGMTSALRQEDRPDNLWNVYNRTQENLISGGVTVQHVKTGKFRRTRGLRAVKPLIELNRGMWDLAGEFLPN